MIATTLRAGDVDCVQAYEYRAATVLPLAPTARLAGARPKIRSAAAAEIVAPKIDALAPGIAAGRIIERGAYAARRAASVMGSRSITSTPTAPASSARRSRTGPAGPVGRAGGRGFARAAASTSIAAAAPKRFGRSAQLGSGAGREGAAPRSAPRNTATLPRKRAASSVTLVSPQRPANTAAARADDVPVYAFTALGVTGTQSVRNTSGRPSTIRRSAAASKPIGPKGSTWKKVPSSPAGLKPKR